MPEPLLQADIAVIVAARDAETTLPDTLGSLLDQTLVSWEALVVDDGSRDDTRNMAAKLSGRDERVRVLETAGVGAGAARNLALKRAAAPWILFLDADDSLTPEALESLHARACAAPHADVVHGRWRFVLPSGEQLPPQPVAPDQPFSTLARTDPFAIHACLHRRKLLLALGGFDTSLVTCEDWDLLQRLARAGARFASVEQLVALYRLRDGSAMTMTGRLARDAVAVIERGHRADPRVSEPDARYAAGADSAGLAEAIFETAAWISGLAIARGARFEAVLDAVGDLREAALDPAALAASIADAVPRGRNRPPTAWPELWPATAQPISELLDAVEGMARAPGLARRARAALERAALERAAPANLTAIGRVAAMDLELAAPISDVAPQAGVEKLILGLQYQGERLGSAELPVCDGVVPGDVLADAAAQAVFWHLLGRYFASTVYPDLRRSPEALRARHFDPAELVGADQSRLHDEIGWTVLLQELWDKPALAGEAFYRPPARPRGRRRLVAAAGRLRAPTRTVLELSWPQPELSGPVELVIHMGGVALGIVAIHAAGHLEPGEVRARVIDALGLELARAAVREGLIGQPATGPSLRERLAAAASASHRGRLGPELAAADVTMDDGMLLLARRDPYEFGSSASRRAALPATAAGDLRALAEALREPFRPPAAGTAPTRSAYVPEWITARRARASLRWRRRPQRDHPGPSVSARLPILMYHRVARAGGRAGARWRVTPEQLDEQLAFLRSKNFSSLSLADWHEAMARRRPAAGRRVCITFDDAYRDFAEHAWPLLRRHGFEANVFVVTGEAGGWNRWDETLGERLRLLDWGELAALRDDGVMIGSHTASHRPLAALPPVEVVREAARSRTKLRERLGIDARILAYPHGDFDRSVEHLVGACGFRQALTCLPGRSSLDDRPLALPRVEITDRTGVDGLSKMLGLADEPI